LTRALALFFGKDDVTFTVTSDYPDAAQKTRTYSRFSDMASDMVDARIYHGIHFRFGDEAAREQGQAGSRVGLRTRCGRSMMTILLGRETPAQGEDVFVRKSPSE
jgi:hypothetical protein